MWYSSLLCLSLSLSILFSSTVSLSALLSQSRSLSLLFFLLLCLSTDLFLSLHLSLLCDLSLSVSSSSLSLSLLLVGDEEVVLIIADVPGRVTGGTELGVAGGVAVGAELLLLKVTVGVVEGVGEVLAVLVGVVVEVTEVCERRVSPFCFSNSLYFSFVLRMSC